MFPRVYNNKIMSGICGFVDSAYFPLALGAFVLMFHVLALDIAGLAFIAFVAIFVCVFSKDLRPLISVIFLAQLVLSIKTDNNEVMGYFLKKEVLFPVATLLGLLVIAIVARLIVTRKRLHRPRFNGLTAGFLAWGVALMLSGLFSSHLTWRSVMFALSLVATELGFYLLFFMAVDSRPDNIEYVCKAAAVTAGVMVLEMINFYAVTYTLGTPLDSAWKERIAFGWAFSNLIGEFLVFLMPAVFCLVHTQKHGGAYYVLAIAVMAATYFTLGRNALLVGVPTFAVGTVLCIVTGRNKKAVAIIAAVLAAAIIAAGAYFLLRPGSGNLFEFFRATKLKDRGRFVLWRNKLLLFLEDPIFGSGFVGHGESLYLAHNTLVQLLSSSGVVGFAAYLFHRIQTVSVFLRKPSYPRSALGVCVFVLLVMGLLDPVTFYANCSFYYTIFLVIAEKDCIAAAPPLSRSLLYK